MISCITSHGRLGPPHSKKFKTLCTRSAFLTSLSSSAVAPYCRRMDLSSSFVMRISLVWVVSLAILPGDRPLGRAPPSALAARPDPHDGGAGRFVPRLLVPALALVEAGAVCAEAST